MLTAPVHLLSILLPFEQHEREREGQRGLKRAFCMYSSIALRSRSRCSKGSDLLCGYS